MADEPNTLYFGDNLDILRRYVPDASVDLVYLDPPFNSNINYNMLFKEQSGKAAAAQIQAFEDTWHWADAALAYEEVVETGGGVAEAMIAFRRLLGTSDMLAYLTMMAPRLVELHRVLRPTGSIYLHCDPTASHYLKILMDAIFEPQCYLNEVIWKRVSAHNDGKQGAKHFGRAHDIVLVYTRSEQYRFTTQYRPYSDAYITSHYNLVEPGTERRYQLDNLTGPGGAANGNPYYEVFGIGGYWRYSEERMAQLIAEGRVVQPKPGSRPRLKRYLDEMQGSPMQDVWDDIPPINSQAQERLGYPTQKPIALLERIISTSSNPGDVVLDPFCGCGTAIAAAQKLGRRWIGIDVTHLAIALMRTRLQDAFGELVNKTYRVIGEPTTLPDAHALAAQDKFQFQYWALGLVGARPQQQKKGADHGIDGRLYFHDEAGAGTKQVIFSVKGGHTDVGDVRDLRGVLDREKAHIGVLISLHAPTQPMRAEAASAGFYASPWTGKKHPRLQLLTIAELLDGRQVDMPPLRQVNTTFKRAPKAESTAAADEVGLWESAEGE